MCGHEGMSHAGSGGGALEDKEEILCFGLAGCCGSVSFGLCLARVGSCGRGFLVLVGELFIGGVGSGCRGSSSAWWSRSVGLVQRVVLVLSYLGSAFVLLHGLILVQLALLGGGSSGKRRIFGKARCSISPARGQ